MCMKGISNIVNCVSSVMLTRTKIRYSSHTTYEKKGHQVKFHRKIIKNIGVEQKTSCWKTTSNLAWIKATKGTIRCKSMKKHYSKYGGGGGAEPFL